MKLNYFKRSTLRFSLFAFSLLLFINMIVQYFSFSGYAATDDKSYMIVARVITEGLRNWSLNGYSIIALDGPVYFDFGALRYAYTLPLAFFYQISNANLSSLFIFNGLMSFFLSLSVYIFSINVTRDKWVSFICASLVTILPLNVVFNGFLGVDIIQISYIVLSLYFFDSSLSNYNKPKGKLFSLLGGVFFGLAYSAKLSSLIFAIPLAIFYIFVFREKVISFKVISFGLISVFGFSIIYFLELAIHYYYFGDFISRLDIISSDKVAELYKWRMGQHGIEIYERLLYFHNMMMKSMGWSFWGLFILCILSITTSRRHLLLWLSALWCFFYITFGSTSLTEYLPPPIKIRYYVLPVTMFLMCSVFFVNDMVNYILRAWKGGEVISSSIISVILVMLIAFVYRESFRFVETQAGNLYRSLSFKSYLYIRESRNVELGLKNDNVIYDHYFWRWFEPVDSSVIPHIPNEAFNKAKFERLLESGFYYWVPFGESSKSKVLKKINAQLSLYDQSIEASNVKILVIDYHCPLPSYMRISNLFSSQMLKRSVYQDNEGRCDKGNVLFYVVKGSDSSDLIFNTTDNKYLMVHNRRPEYVDVYNELSQYSVFINGNEMPQKYAVLSFFDKLRVSLPKSNALTSINENSKELQVDLTVKQLSSNPIKLEYYIYFYGVDGLLDKAKLYSHEIKGVESISKSVKIPVGTKKLNLGIFSYHQGRDVSFSVGDIRIRTL